MFTFTLDAPASGATAVRLEVFPDDSLPGRGPGRADNGNLHLSQVELLAFEPDAKAGRPVAIRSATADFNQEGWTIAHSIDGKDETAWGIHPNVGERHEAVFELSAFSTPQVSVAEAGVFEVWGLAGGLAALPLGVGLLLV